MRKLRLVFAGSRKSPCHGAPVVMNCPPRGEPRCGECGHRVPGADGISPVQSRRLPPWTWPGEAWGRRVARSSAARAARLQGQRGEAR